MLFIHKRTSAKFYNHSRMTFLVQKDCVDVVFKIRRGVYLTVSVYALSKGRLLLACAWGEFWNRLKKMRNHDDVIARLKKTCPLTANIFTNTESPHFVYLDKENKEGAIALEMKAPIETNSISDYLHEKVVAKAIVLMEYNLNLYTELEEKCPFPIWKQDLQSLVYG